MAGAAQPPTLAQSRWPGWLRAPFDGLADPLGALARARGDLFLWLPVLLALGIGGYFARLTEPGPAVYAGAAALVLIGAVLWSRGPEVVQLPAAAVAVVAAGLLLAGARAHQVAAPVLGFRYYGPVEGRIISIDRSGTDRIRLTLDQVVLERMVPARTPKTVRVALHGDQSHLLPEPGLRVMLTGHLAPPAGPAAPGAYDFRRQAWFSGLGAVGYARAPVMVLAPPDPDDWALAGHRARMRLSAAIQTRIPGQPGAVAAALMTGDRSGIAEATNEAMRASNLYHIISISGLHMGMLAGFVFAALRYGLAATGNLALRWPVKKIAAAAALVAATVYLWLAGPNVATERAYVMAAVMLLAVLVDRRAISLRTVALAALILLVAEPESLTEPGFQMSFGATVALILIYGPWSAVEHRLPVLLKPVAMLLVTSLAAGLVTAPIAAAHFNRMPEYGLLANLLAVPVMGMLVMPAGVIAALLSPFGLAAPALWVMQQGTAWMILVAEQVAALEGAVLAVPAPPAAVLPLLAGGASVATLGRGVARSAGGLMLALAAALWVGAARPALLIAPEGELVGLMTPAGRALSKTGAGFVAESWLEADGDTARPETAAARAGFSGQRGGREAELAGRRLLHLTGKAAAEKAPDACREGAVVVLAAAAPKPPEDCLWVDQTILRQTGALAIDADATGALVITRAAEVAGTRLWSGAGPKGRRAVPAGQ
ncbi:ComEC/Rec2 family competence protein [Phaeovulum veldkampii]|uniref:ComEC/Rec2 family competence protein n=1 Tax=Phaeovulum veldkampii TaxID=33049 RepID=UPI001F2529C0|nr:ComEC/Rec2 family competence protein [Phaeovulum veldkampii]